MTSTLSRDEYEEAVSKQKERLEMIIDEAYRNLGLKSKRQIGNQYLQILDSACTISREIEREEQKMIRIAEKKEIKEADRQTEIFLTDSKKLLENLQGRDEKWKKINSLIIQVLSQVNQQAYDLKNRTIRIKQNTLLKSTVDQMKEIHEKLKKKHESENMFKNLRLKKDIDDGQYTLNQIKKQTDQTLKILMQKTKKRDEELRRLKIQNQQAVKFNEELLKQEILVKTNQLLRVQQPKQKKIMHKIPQIENQVKQPQKIEPILTQIIVKQKDSYIERVILISLVILTIIILVLKF